MAVGNAPLFVHPVPAAPGARSFRAGQNLAELQNLRLARSPPTPLRGYGATALARLAEPKLGDAERRLVDLTRIELVTS
jgi:hypothetical protein